MVAESLGCTIVRDRFPKGFFPGRCDSSWLQTVRVSSYRAPGACTARGGCRIRFPETAGWRWGWLSGLGVASFSGLPSSLFHAGPAQSSPITASCIASVLWYPWISPVLWGSVSSEACPVPCFFLVWQGLASSRCLRRYFIPASCL